MRYNDFGNSGMKVSQLSLGTWGMGGVGWDGADDAQRLDTIAAAVEAGVNLFDTAPAYNAGVAERYVGRGLEALGCRDKVYIATKCGTAYTGGAYVRNNGAAFITQQCEESLENLRTDYIDLYLIHWPDANVPIAETMGALNKLKDQGKIRHIGVSNFSQAQMEEAGQYGVIDGYQGQFSMVNCEQAPLMQWVHSQGMGVMTYGSLGAGILTGAYRTLKQFAEGDNRARFYKHFQEPMFSKVMELLVQMDTVAASRQVPLSQIALNWAAQKDFVSTTIVGAQHRHKILENAQAFGWMLTAQEMAFLDEAVATALAL